MRRSALPLLLVLSLLVAACGSSVEASLGADPTTSPPATEDSPSTDLTTTSTTAAPTTTTTMATTTSIDPLPSEDEFGLMVGLGMWTGLLGLDPTDAQFGCMTSIEALTVEPDPSDEFNLPFVMMQMCMPDELTASMVSQFESTPGVTAGTIEDFACLTEFSLQRLDGMDLNARLVDARTEARPDELAAAAEQCQMTAEDIEALEQAG